MTDTVTNAAPFGIEKVRELLPHRYPFLLIDKVLEVDEKRIVAVKCVSANEPFFQGHFPHRPIMPGVLQVEAMAQAGALHAKLNPAMSEKLMVLAGVDEAKFRRIVQPGDVLRIESEVLVMKKISGRSRARITVEGELASEAVITFIAVPDSAG
jgi:3-hydroxyacyl-[acyl-carrier-protein] dehydratase